MPIEFRCPNCETAYRINAASAGKEIMCKKCPTFVNVPLRSDPVAAQKLGPFIPSSRQTPASPEPSVFHQEPPRRGTMIADLLPPANQPKPHAPPAVKAPAGQPLPSGRPPVVEKRSRLIPGLIAAMVLITTGGGGLAYWLVTKDRPKAGSGGDLAVADRGRQESKPTDAEQRRIEIIDPNEPKEPAKDKSDVEPKPIGDSRKTLPNPRLPEPIVETKPAGPGLPADTRKTPGLPAAKNNPVDPIEKREPKPQPPAAKNPKPGVPLPVELLALVQQLDNKDPKTKIAALEALAKMGEAAAPASTAICDCLLDPSPKVVTAALEAVEKARPDLYKPVASIVLDKERNQKDNSLRKLASFGEEAAPMKNVILTLTSQILTSSASMSIDELVYSPPLTMSTGVLIETYEKICPEIARENLVPLFKEHAKSSTILGVFDSVGEYRYQRNRRELAHVIVYGWHDTMKRLLDWAGENPVRRKEIIPLLKAGLGVSSLPHLEFSLKTARTFGKDAAPLTLIIKQLKTSSDEKIRDAAKQALDAIEADM